ncbi:hypothetical protein [Roseofilum casamattae]|uniref:Permease n=1 Tax=Roseofilum casamattae BLCC-M143 TaxID=3022442 RepID=A0ABT7BXV6_9CYAN|nr:hypothetical protein [Roseofilum casamattae]MDJ1183113.1 hypothetical protein [Roseofilum casamattae BLCC-M143]
MKSTFSNFDDSDFLSITESGFSFRWTLYTLIGFVLSLLLIEVGERPDIGIIEGLIGGTIIGIVQWIVLQPYLKGAWWWIIISSLSWAIMGWSGLGAIGWTAPRTLSLSLRFFYGMLEGARTGFILSVGQYLLLSRHVPYAWRWVFLNTFIWAISLTCGWTIGGLLRIQFNQFLGDVVGLGLLWLLTAALNSFALKMLFTYPDSSFNDHRSN